jgi:hypothetical protein
MALKGCAQQHGRAHGMADGKERRRAIRQHDLAHQRFEIEIVFGEVAHVAAAAIRQRTVGKALSAPIKDGDGEAARPQIAHGLEIFLDPFAAAGQDAHRAAAAGRRQPAGESQRNPVGRFERARHYAFGNGIRRDRDELHRQRRAPRLGISVVRYLRLHRSFL